MDDISVRWAAPSNIAVIKYWGKRDTNLNLPINSSVSLTLHQDQLKAVTTIVASKSFSHDQFWLNGVEECIESNKRMSVVIQEVRTRARDRTSSSSNEEDGGDVIVKRSDWPLYRIQIKSNNTFPTAAGLASSAAGYACLTSALCDLYCVQERYPGEISTIARQGSGSACRSMYGGFVQWDMGVALNGSDSKATPIASELYWDELESIILVVSASRKETPSTAGMQQSIQSSPLLQYRAEKIVPNRLKLIKEAYLNKDFSSFGKLTMQDSNQFHATCLDTFPPIFYLNSTSKAIIRLIHEYNAKYGEIVACYTFDAGPNAVIFATKEHIEELLSLFVSVFPPPPTNTTTNNSYASTIASDYIRSSDTGLAETVFERREREGETLIQKYRDGITGIYEGDVSWIYHTKVGCGPVKL